MKKLNKDEILARTSELSVKKVGYAAIVWRPNTWKSTFINTFLWRKISIVSGVPQTTRKRILAIFNDEESQIIFFDTPWIHIKEKLFNETINAEATKSLNDADVILYFIDSSRAGWDEEKKVKQIISNYKRPVIKVYTKIDLESKIDIPISKSSIKLSSVNKDGFEELITSVKWYLKKQPILFPEDFYTSQNMYFRISEIIREKIFLNTREELPHSIYVEVEDIQDNENLLKIQAYIYCDSESQKNILIWRRWELLSKIWKEARLTLESIFENKVYLWLRIKVKKNWRKNEGLIKKLFE